MTEYTRRTTDEAMPVPEWILGLTEEQGRPTASDIEIVVAATASLEASAVRSPSVWRAFPLSRSSDAAASMVIAFEVASASAHQLHAANSGYPARFGIDTSGAATQVVERVREKLHDEQTALDAVSALCEVTTTDFGISDPSIEDILFVLDVQPSLAAANLELISHNPMTSTEFEIGAGIVEELETASDLVYSEFSFRPGDHSDGTLGGIRRAFEGKRAADFVQAMSMLGVPLATPDKAQRAAALMRDYLAIAGKLSAFATTLMTSQGSKRVSPTVRQAVSEKARLVASVERRVGMLVTDLDHLSPALKKLGRGHISPDMRIKPIEIDTAVRRTIMDAIVPGQRLSGQTIRDGISERTTAAIAWLKWMEGRIALAGKPDIDMAALDRFTTENPATVRSSDGSFTIGTLYEAEELRTHASWLREATMLPLSDEALDAFVAHVARKRSETALGS